MKREIEYEGRRYLVSENEILAHLSTHLPLVYLNKRQEELALKQPTMNPETGYPFYPHRFK